jgi:hypothetical protein
MATFLFEGLGVFSVDGIGAGAKSVSFFLEGGNISPFEVNEH